MRTHASTRTRAQTPTHSLASRATSALGEGARPARTQALAPPAGYEKMRPVIWELCVRGQRGRQGRPLPLAPARAERARRQRHVVPRCEKMASPMKVPHAL